MKTLISFQFQDRLEHLDLIEGIVVDLLKTKWRCFIKQNFFNQIFRFTIYFLISLYCFVIRPVGTGTECVPIGNSTDLMDMASNITNFSTLEAMTTASLFPDGVTEEYLTTMLMSNITRYTILQTNVKVTKTLRTYRVSKDQLWFLNSRLQILRSLVHQNQDVDFDPDTGDNHLVLLGTQNCKYFA